VDLNIKALGIYSTIHSLENSRSSVTITVTVTINTVEARYRDTGGSQPAGLAEIHLR
jgi:hypothetical protein